MNRRSSRCLAAVAVALLFSGAAFAYTLLSPPRRWFPSDVPRAVLVDTTGLYEIDPPDPDHGVSQAVTAAESWNGGTPGTLIDASSGAVTGIVSGDSSSVVWMPGQFEPPGDCQGNCLALTIISQYDDDQVGCCNANLVRITDADVEFNSSGLVQFPRQWCSFQDLPCTTGETLVEAVMSHEIGHLLGLGHSALSSAVMYATYNGVYPPTADDLAGRDQLYGCTNMYIGSCSGGGGHPPGDCRPVCYTTP